MPVTVEPWGNGAAFRVKVHAGAKRNRVEGAPEGWLRVSVAAAPERGKANRAVLALLAKALRAPPSSLAILSGDTDARKRIGVSGLAPEELSGRLAALMEMDMPRKMAGAAKRPSPETVQALKAFHKGRRLNGITLRELKEEGRR